MNKCCTTTVSEKVLTGESNCERKIQTNNMFSQDKVSFRKLSPSICLQQFYRMDEKVEGAKWWSPSNRPRASAKTPLNQTAATVQRENHKVYDAGCRQKGLWANWQFWNRLEPNSTWQITWTGWLRCLGTHQASESTLRQVLCPRSPLSKMVGADHCQFIHSDYEEGSDNNSEDDSGGLSYFVDGNMNRILVNSFRHKILQILAETTHECSSRCDSILREENESDSREERDYS